MSRPVFCGNFEYETRQSDLERLFSKYGRVERVDMKSAMTESSNTQRTRAQEEYSRRNDSECKEERDQRNKRRRDRYKEKKMNAEKDRLYLCTGDQGPIQQSMPSLNVESCGQLANTHQAKTPSIDPDCSPLTEIESLEEARLKSLIKGLKVEYGILDKLVYKNKNQHRRSSYFQYLVKVTRDLRVLLQSADLEHIFNSSFLVIHGKRPKHKVQLLESLKRRKCHGNYSFLDRLLGIARLLSQIIEPIVKAAMEISALIARSFFMGFSLAIMALLARLRVLVQQMLLDVVSVYNTVSSLSRKEQSVKLTQDGLEVYRDLYPAREQAVYLDCVWKTDKFVLFENVSEHVDTNQDAIPIDVYPGEASTVQYQCIETLLGDTDEPVTVDQSFTHEQGSSDIKGNNQCFLEGSTDRTNDGKLVTDGREGQCFAGVAAICSEKRPTEGAFLKNKSESRNKVAFVSVKMPITSAQDAVIPVKDSESCGNTEDPALRLIADGNLKEILL